MNVCKVHTFGNFCNFPIFYCGLFNWPARFHFVDKIRIVAHGVPLIVCVCGDSIGKWLVWCQSWWADTQPSAYISSFSRINRLSIIRSILNGVVSILFLPFLCILSFILSKCIDKWLSFQNPNNCVDLPTSNNGCNDPDHFSANVTWRTLQQFIALTKIKFLWKLISSTKG